MGTGVSVQAVDPGSSRLMGPGLAALPSITREGWLPRVSPTQDPVTILSMVSTECVLLCTIVKRKNREPS